MPSTIKRLVPMQLQTKMALAEALTAMKLMLAETLQKVMAPMHLISRAATRTATCEEMMTPRRRRTRLRSRKVRRRGLQRHLSPLQRRRSRLQRLHRWRSQLQRRGGLP